MPRAKLGHVEDPTAPANVLHDDRWQERGAFGDGGRGVAEMTESRLAAAPKRHSGRWQRRALEPHVQLPRREHFDDDGGDRGARIGNPYKHYGRWEMRACFGDGRPFYGPLKDAPGPDVDCAYGDAKEGEDAGSTGDKKGSGGVNRIPEGVIPASGWEARAYFGDGGRHVGWVSLADARSERCGVEMTRQSEGKNNFIVILSKYTTVFIVSR